MSVLKHFKECEHLTDYLKTLPVAVLLELFSSPPSCLAIFRELPALAQQYVLRILYVDQAVPQAVVATWVSKPFIEKHTRAIEALTSLRIWNDSPMPGGLNGWTLNHSFRHNLKIGLLGGGTAWTRSKELGPDNKPKTVQDLDTYTLQRWEAVLRYLADTEKATQTDIVSRDTIQTLTDAGLMETEGDRIPSITNQGFQFLLLDTASQVWYFIVKYLETVEGRGIKLAECLSFLLALSFATLGRDYSTDGFSEPMQTFMQHLREFGLLYQRTRKAGRFYPTRLALNLITGKRHIALDTDKHKTGFLVVETNYRVYAYSDSDLQLALVRMFTDYLYRLPNVVVGVLSRESVNQALRSGISAEQIITFLKKHAHDEMIKSAANPTNPLPPSIVDQIRLWEMERNRLKYTPSALYTQFLSQNDYEVVRNYAQKTGVLAHASDQKRTVVVLEKGHEDIKRFWKKYSRGAGGS